MKSLLNFLLKNIVIFSICFFALGSLVGFFASPRKNCAQINCSISKSSVDEIISVGNLIISETNLNLLVDNNKTFSISLSDIRNSLILDLKANQDIFSVVFSTNKSDLSSSLAYCFKEYSIPYLESRLLTSSVKIAYHSDNFYTTRELKYCILNSVLAGLSFSVLFIACSCFLINKEMIK